MSAPRLRHAVTAIARKSRTASSTSCSADWTSTTRSRIASVSQSPLSPVLPALKIRTDDENGRASTALHLSHELETQSRSTPSASSVSISTACCTTDAAVLLACATARMCGRSGAQAHSLSRTIEAPTPTSRAATARPSTKVAGRGEILPPPPTLGHTALLASMRACSSACTLAWCTSWRPPLSDSRLRSGGQRALTWSRRTWSQIHRFSEYRLLRRTPLEIADVQISGRPSICVIYRSTACCDTLV